MQKYSSLSGIVGIILIAFGAIPYLFTRTLDLYVAINLIAGVTLLLAFFISRIRELRELLTGKALVSFGVTFTASLLIVVILVFANLAVSLYPKQWDLTREKLYSLTPPTLKLLSSLKGKVHGYLFQEGGVIPPNIQDLLRLYQDATRNFSYEVVDPQTDPDLVNKYDVHQNGTLVLELEGTLRTQKVTKLTEEEITNALNKLISGESVTVGFLINHGERSIDSNEDPQGLGALKAILSDQNYQVKTIDLIAQGSVPQDVQILVIPAPSSPLYPGEIRAITEFVRNGGGVFLLADPSRREPMDPLVREFGVQLGVDIILDQTLRLFAGPTLGTQIVVSRYPDHEITRELREATVFQEACSLRLPSTPPSGIRFVELLRSSSESWAETDLNRLLTKREARKDPEDPKGPVVFGAVFTGFPGMVTPEEGARIPRGVVICDSDFISNRMIGQLGNQDLVLNIFAWLAGETQKISVTPKKREFTRISLTQKQTAMTFFLSVLVFPELLLIAGIVVWYRRRV